MVSINATLVIELILFLIFLWGTKTFFLRPMLDTMDKRESRLQEDEECVERDTSDAEKMEDEYDHAIDRTQRKIHEKVEKERRSAIERQLNTLMEHRREGDKEVSQVRDAALKQVEDERQKFASLKPQIVSTIAKRLGIGGLDS